MKISLDYQRKIIGGGDFTTAEWMPSRNNEIKSLLMHYEIDNIVSNSFTKKQRFYGVLYFCNVIDEYIKTKITVGKISEKNNGDPYITLKSYIYYKLMKTADTLDSGTIVAFNKILLLDAIIAGSQKYKIPEENYRELIERRSKLGNIPEWIPEMETNPQLVIDFYKASVPK